MGENGYSAGLNVAIKGRLGRQIVLNDLRGWALEPCMGVLEVSPDFTGMAESANRKIHHLGDIITRQQIGRKRGPIEDKSSKLLVYGDKQMSGSQNKNREVKKIFWGI